MPANFSRAAGTTRFNWLADQTWNLGEGFPSGGFAPDHGGFRDADHEHVGVQDIHPYLDAAGAGGWAPMPGQPMVQRFVGYLRPQSPIANGGQVEDAAFEVFAPTSRDLTKPLVVVIGLWATWATPFLNNQLRDQFVYPGHLRPDGLVPAVGNLPSGNLARPAGPYFVEHPPTNFDVMSAYIVPRNFGRPTVSQMQRAVQLAKAIDLMLAQPTGSALLPPGFDPSSPHHQSPPKVATGGSLGGMCAQLAAVLRPDIFHGASSQVFSGSLARMPGEQFTLNYIGRGTGITLDDTSLNINDSLEWGFYLRQMGSNYFDASSAVRHRLGGLLRPQAHVIGDEDTVTNGVDWIPYFSGMRAFSAQGLVPTGTGGPNFVAWTVVDRRCHGEGGPITTPINGTPNSAIDQATVELIPHAYATWVANPLVIPTTLTDDGSEDCYAHALARGPFSATPPPTNPYLELDPQFGPNGQGRTVGQGLALGIDESIRAYPMNLPGETGDSIFVGSFDGIVTRYVRDPTTNELVVAAQSESLGHGAWALDVDDLTGTHSGPEVVVGTMRAIHVLDAATLVRIASTDLDFEHEAPRRLKIAHVHDLIGPATEKDIVFTTFHGHLMVLGSDLSVRTDLGEPGIQDFVVHEGESYSHATTSSKVPITLMSHRGHLVNVTLSDEATFPTLLEAEIHCWTAGQVGAPRDLEVAQLNGQRVVVASYRRSVISADTLELFDALTLQVAGSYGAGEVLPTGDLTDVECVHDAQGQLAGFVVLEKEFINWIPVGSPSGTRKGFLYTFSPAHRPVALRVADLIPGSAPYQEELVVSTLSGHVVCIEVGTLTAMSGPPSSINLGHLTLPRPAVPGAFNQTFPQTNRALAGTWGMVSRMVCLGEDVCLWRIYAANQAGELFEVDPQNGATAWLADIRHVYEVPGPSGVYRFPGQPGTPIRDLVVLGDQLVGVRPHSDRLWKAVGSLSIFPVGYPAPPSGSGWLETRPWVNLYQQPYSPVWYQHPSDFGTMPPDGAVYPSNLPVYGESLPGGPQYDGLAAFSGSGAVTGKGLDPNGEIVRQAHWWGGKSDTYPNLVQGAYVSATPNSTIADTWYSTKNNGATYGWTTADCKDLRNNVKNDDGSTFNLQSLRLGIDPSGTVAALNTSGGGVIALRPGQAAIPSLGAPGTAPGTDMGQVLWDASNPLSGPILDDGFGGMALATRQVPGTPTYMDIFSGAALTYPDPTALVPNPSSFMVGSVRWLRWDGTAMTAMGSPKILEPSLGDPRGGFAVSGLAVGDVLDAHEGQELVVTTLAGDLYVFELGTSIGMQLLHTWVPGSLGAYNSILIEDLDFDLRKELYVAGSQGIWKWRQK